MNAWVKGCLSKNSYETMGEAVKACEEMAVRHYVLARFYECLDCGMYHISAVKNER